MSIFQRTKEIAKSKGLNLRQLEDKAGLGTNSLYRWKTYNPRMESLNAVADVLGVSTDYLLGNTDNIVPIQEKSINEPMDLYEVDDSERDEMVSAGGRPISDEDWAIIKAVLAKYPKRED